MAHTRRKHTLKNIKGTVKGILIKDEKARDSDKYLYLKVVEFYCPYLIGTAFEDAITDDRIPCYESVRRARQWIQSKFPELCGSDEVEAMRVVREEEYRDFARQVTE